MAAAKSRVLMVCLGNICRSPTAEAVLRAKLVAAGLDRRIEVASAGLSGLHAGEPPDARAIKHAAQRGYDLRKQRARRFSSDDFRRFDQIFAMDQANLAELQHLSPTYPTAKLGLLMAHARRHPGVNAVPDPYYGPPAGFEQVLDMVEDACEGLLSALVPTEGTS